MVVHGELLFVGELPECSKSQSDPELKIRTPQRSGPGVSGIYSLYTYAV